MKIALIVISVALAAMVIAVIRTKSKGIQINSFWDVVRHPDAMPDLDQLHKEVEKSASAISGSESKIKSLVDYFVFEAKSSDDAWTEKRIIAKLGAEAYPRALELLRDASSRERLAVLSVADGSSLPEAPVCRLAEIFDQDTPPPLEAAGLLTPFLRSESDAIRKSVALIIGSVGTSQSLPELQLALKDEDEDVRSYALMGIQRAIEGGRIKPTEKAQFYETVAGMWPEDTSFEVSEGIPEILLGLDRDRAVGRLLQPDLFTAKFEPVWRILEVFDEEAVDVPRAKLLELINEASQEPDKYPMNNVLEGALSLLGKHRVEEDLPTLERFMDHPDKDVSGGAVKGLYAYHGYFEKIRNPQDVVKTGGWGALTTAEKHICAIEELDAEVRNGGFAQYFFNSYSNHWQDALSGLAAIGATQRHQIMAATVAKFGPSGPSSVRETRNAQLSKIVRKLEDPFDGQDTAWYGTENELLERLMLRYNLAHLQGRQKADQDSGGPPASGSGSE